MLEALAIVVALVFLAPDLLQSPLISTAGGLLAGAIAIPLALALDTVLYAAFGTTPARAMAGLRVCGPDGNRISALAYLRRNARLWVFGLGLAIPLITLLTLIASYRTANAGNLLSWERDGESRVRGERNTLWRTTLVAAGYLLLTAPLAFLHTMRTGSPEFEVRMIAAIADRQVGEMLDDDTRVDGVRAEPGKVLAYLYTKTKLSAGEEAATEFAQSLQENRATFVREMCRSSDIREVLKIARELRFRYRDHSGNPLVDVSLTAADCT